MIDPTQAINAVGSIDPTAFATTTSTPASPVRISFGDMLMDGVEQVNGKLQEADALTQAFALGEDIPIHQVTYALEQARLSFELMMQVRTRLLESYQEILRMQV